jgi:hypothetical protein
MNVTNWLTISKVFGAVCRYGSVPHPDSPPPLAQVNFSSDWAGNAVSPHRDFQRHCFQPYPVDGGRMVPHCEWNLWEEGDGGLEGWVFGCHETRPTGYEGTGLFCDANETEDPTDCNGITDGNGGVICTPGVCENSCVEFDFIPDNQDPPPAEFPIQPNGDCENWMDNCEGTYTWNQMGSFDSENVWSWNSEFTDMIAPFASVNPDTTWDDSYWTPVKGTGDATPGKLAKLANFVSQSVSSQSQSLGSGDASQVLTF